MGSEWVVSYNYILALVVPSPLAQHEPVLVVVSVPLHSVNILLVFSPVRFLQQDKEFHTVSSNFTNTGGSFVKISLSKNLKTFLVFTKKKQ